ncbi:MAG TPA: septum formation initiator family protein [Pyrinomonadaceae bacterium]|nr:septum formation initiator family protein [Pyrinomonadaceae bacterium]
MNKAANTYWTDSRLDAQRPAARPLTLAAPARELSRELVGTRAEVRRRGGLIPSWAVFIMIMLATFALCVTVTMRTHAERRNAEQKFSQMTTEVQAISNTNESLKREIKHLQDRNSRAVEDAARARLNMIRPNEIVVPVKD